MTDFSVLMSIYNRESVSNFIGCMDSIINQTIKPNEIVLVIDGPLYSDLTRKINWYIEKCTIPIKKIELEENVGLGKALSIGLKECSYEIVARMDTDDICRNDRFEKQLNVFENNRFIDVCGSHIMEFESDVNNIVSKRKVPLNHNEIVEFQKKRSAVNHMSVMYKKSSVLNSGNYEDELYMEDDLLWYKMIANNCVFQNIDDFLVYVRVGKSMFDRRGGLTYLFIYIKTRYSFYKKGYITYFDFIVTAMAQSIVAIMPNKIRRIIFLNILRTQ